MSASLTAQNRDRRLMAQALRLARRAEGRTAPNPPVGAVVVKAGRIVGQGFHAAAGMPHAEVVALDQAGKKAKNATIYVTLEPCNHHGRTPPCTERILASGVSRVVVGSLDPNPNVAGGGIERLKRAGLEVEAGVLADRCDALLAPFAKHAATGRPWVTLKMAASLDGKIAVGPGKSQWLTGSQAKAWAHRLRNVCEAILVGRGTVEIDDPALTTRLARRKGQNPLRVVLDSKLALDPEAKVVTGPRDGGPAGGGLLVLTRKDAPAHKARALEAAGAEVVGLPAGEGGLDLEAVLDELGRRGVMRLMVEGGPSVAGRMIRAGLIDEVYLIFAPLLIGGESAPSLLGGPSADDLTQALGLGKIEFRRLGRDLLVHGLAVK